MSETELFRWYQITDMDREERWRNLVDHALPQLGLEHVVKTIAMLVRRRRAQLDKGRRNAYAIGEWEYDLQRLKSHFYSPGQSGFEWPRTDG